jgi:hypothetical protein
MFSILKYLFNLILFLLVPGLHLIAAKRPVFGWSVSIMATVGAIGTRIIPVAPDRTLFLINGGLSLFYVAAIIVSWIFVLRNIKRIRQTSVLKPLNMLTLISLISFAPYTEEFVINTETGIQMCPVICFGDVTVSKKVVHAAQETDLLIPGKTIIYEHLGMTFSNQILAGPDHLVCIEELKRKTIPKNSVEMCENKIRLGNDEYYVVGKVPDLKGGLMFHGDFEISHVGIVLGREILGIEPVVVANWSEASKLMMWGAGHIYDMTIHFPVIHNFIFGSS